MTTMPILDLPKTQAWAANAPNAMDSLASALQNLNLNGNSGPNHVQIFQETVVNHFNVPNPQFSKSTPHTVRAFIDLTKYTLQETQKQLFEMTGQYLNSANDVEVAQNQIARTTTELTQLRGQFNALAQRMPSGRLLSTAAVGIFLVGALISHVATQMFSSPSDLLQNDCADCTEKLTDLHGEYKKMQALGQDCLDQRKVVGEKLTTCADLLQKAVKKK